MTLVQFINYAKKFCVALVAALAILATALADGSISPAEWVQIVIAFLGSAGVYQATNSDKTVL